MLRTVLKGCAFSCCLAVKALINIFNEHPLGEELFGAHSKKLQVRSETSVDCTILKCLTIFNNSMLFETNQFCVPMGLLVQKQ